MKDNIQVFEKYSVPKAVATMALPSMLSMLINIVYNLADTFFVGQTGDSNQVAAVSVSMPLFLLFIAVGNLFGVGGCAFVSRSLGEGKMDKVKSISSFCIYGSIFVGVILGIVFFVFKTPILYLVGASDNTIGYAVDYLQWVSIGSPFVVTAIAVGNLVRGEGAAKESMIGMVLGQLVNIVLDPIFILDKGDKLFGLSFAYGNGKDTSAQNVITSLSRILYNVPINKYFALDLNGIAPINDAIGGVTVTSLYDFKNVDISKGDEVHLTGDLTEIYVRTRDMDNIEASLNRTARQVQYIKAFASQLAPAVMNDFSIVSKLYNTAMDYSTTNITLSDATYLASLLVSKGINDFETATIEGEMKKSENVENADIVFAEFYPDEDKLMELVLDTFYTQIS